MWRWGWLVGDMDVLWSEYIYIYIFCVCVFVSLDGC